MSQVFDEHGSVIPITVLEARQNVVTQVKTSARDGYEALQVASGPAKQLSRPLAGHLKGLGQFRWARETRGKTGDFKRGDAIDASVFAKGDKVDVIARSKGKGFQGVVKRHGFGGASKTHGTKHAHREPGSIGATHPQHVVKGRKMAGHMGSVRVTTKNLEVVAVDAARNLLSLKGAVPGSRGTLVIVRGRQK